VARVKLAVRRHADRTRFCSYIKILDPRGLARAAPILYRFLLNKWYFDEVYDAVIVGG
jgi:hypothetical protein